MSEMTTQEMIRVLEMYRGPAFAHLPTDIADAIAARLKALEGMRAKIARFAQTGIDINRNGDCVDDELISAVLDAAREVEK